MVAEGGARANGASSGRGAAAAEDAPLLEHCSFLFLWPHSLPTRSAGDLLALASSALVVAELVLAAVRVLHLRQAGRQGGWLSTQ